MESIMEVAQYPLQLPKMFPEMSVGFQTYHLFLLSFNPHQLKAPLLASLALRPI